MWSDRNRPVGPRRGAPAAMGLLVPYGLGSLRPTGSLRCLRPGFAWVALPGMNGSLSRRTVGNHAVMVDRAFGPVFAYFLLSARLLTVSEPWLPVAGPVGRGIPLRPPLGPGLVFFRRRPAFCSVFRRAGRAPDGVGSCLASTKWPLGDWSACLAAYSPRSDPTKGLLLPTTCDYRLRGADSDRAIRNRHAAAQEAFFATLCGTGETGPRWTSSARLKGASTGVARNSPPAMPTPTLST